MWSKQFKNNTDYLNQIFLNSWNGARGLVPWSDRSPDLNPLGEIRSLSSKTSESILQNGGHISNTYFISFHLLSNNRLIFVSNK